jgi:hypothetical protein
MTYFADLTPYSYVKISPETDTLNVGWLDASIPYPMGVTSETFQSRLWQYRDGIIWATRGFHICNLCQNPKIAAAHFKQLGLGTAEIRVFYKGKTYAAPDLICHYVSDHQYHPPDEFVVAVLHGELPNSQLYRQLVRQIGVDHSFYNFQHL